MYSDQASEILRRLTQLMWQVERSLSFQQRLPRALRFHRELQEVISEVRHLMYESPPSIHRPPTPGVDNSEPSEGKPAT